MPFQPNVVRMGVVVVSLVLATISCTGSASQPTKPAVPQKGGELDLLMRNKMNKAYTQLMFHLFHAETDTDFGTLAMEAEQLRETVAKVRALPKPPRVQSEQSASVYVTYNDLLLQQADKFVAATAQQNRPEMEALLSKIGKTCNDCHRFFRVEIPDPK